MKTKLHMRRKMKKGGSEERAEKGESKMKEK